MGPTKTSSNLPVSDIDQNIKSDDPDATIKWPNSKTTGVSTFDITVLKIRGIVSILFFTCSALFSVVLVHVVPLTLLKPISPTLWEAWSAWIGNTWFESFVYYIESIANVEFYQSGDDLDSIKHEYVFAISNHPSEGDWMYFWPIASRINYVGYFRAVLKDVLRQLPGPGWAMSNMRFLFVGRKWETDQPVMQHILQYYTSLPGLFLLNFPEGTDFTPKKLQRAIQYAKENNLPHYQNLLLPRLKGFKMCINILRPKLDAVYDITLGYPNGIKPTLFSSWIGLAPHQVHVHIRRFPINQIPLNEAEQEKWCYDCFQYKDQLLNYFQEHQHFPAKLDSDNRANETTKLNSYRWEPRGAKLRIVFMMWIVITGCLMYLFFTNAWMMYLQIGGWVYLLISANSKQMRRWRGIDPPVKAKHA